VKEQKAAAAELEAQENAYKQRIADLEKKSEEGGVVSRNKAKAELEQGMSRHVIASIPSSPSLPLSLSPSLPLPLLTLFVSQ
jgi:hypothetical protein